MHLFLHFHVIGRPRGMAGYTGEGLLRGTWALLCFPSFFGPRLTAYGSHFLSRAPARSPQSCPTLQPRGLQPARLLCPWDSPGKNTGMDYHALSSGRPGIEPVSLASPALQMDFYCCTSRGAPHFLDQRSNLALGSDCTESWATRELPFSKVIFVSIYRYV